MSCCPDHKQGVANEHVGKVERENDREESSKSGNFIEKWLYKIGKEDAQKGTNGSSSCCH